MGQFNYEDFLKKEQERQNSNSERSKITFLSTLLKNNGDNVLVRFPYASANDFEFFSLHRVMIDGNYRNVLCLRSDSEPINLCPLCQKGDKAKDRILIKCIVYIQGEKGIEVLPCVWERPAKFAMTLKERIDTFGNVVYKITRMGKANDKDTTYDVMPTNAQIYNEQAYVSDFSAFDNYRFNNHMFLDRNYNELVEYVTKGKMPERQKENAQTNNTQQVVNQAPIQQTFSAQPQYQQPQQNYYQQPQGQYQQPVQQQYQQPVDNNFNNQFTQSPYPQEQQTQQQPTQQASRPKRVY